MNRKPLILAAALAFAGLGTSLQAAADPGPITPVTSDKVTAGTTSQRDVNQSQRIENGLASGSLSTGEAARLEASQARIDHLQTQALKDGSYSAAEKARIDAAQDRSSQQIYDAKHNDKTGNPNSVSSQNMQELAERNVNQEQRIHDGLTNGSLTNHQAARLERGQARSTALGAAAASDGHVGNWEQRQINRYDNRQSQRIYGKKHDRIVK